MLAIVHNFQFSSAFRKLERDMQNGVIGPVRAIVATQWGIQEEDCQSGMTSCREGFSMTKALICST